MMALRQETLSLNGGIAKAGMPVRHPTVGRAARALLILTLYFFATVTAAVTYHETETNQSAAQAACASTMQQKVQEIKDVFHQDAKIYSGCEFYENGREVVGDKDGLPGYFFHISHIDIYEGHQTGGFHWPSSYPTCFPPKRPQSDGTCTDPPPVEEAKDHCNVGEPGAGGPGGHSGEGEDRCSGNPIDTGNGNKFQIETDLPTSGMLGFTRYYNSDSRAMGDLLGNAWTHSYSRRVFQFDPNSAIVMRPSGTRLGFALVAGQWQPDADVEALLVRLQDGSGNLTGWTYRQQDDREIETYDALGRLVSVIRADGSSIALVYNGGVIENNADDYQLSSVTAQDGRRLSFGYDANGRIATLTDPAGAAITFQYDAENRLASVIYPGGASRAYLYNESAQMGGASRPNALTGIVDEKSQRFATFSYRIDGKAASTEYAGGVNRYSVAYFANGSVTINEPNGATRQRNFVTLLNVPRVSAVTVSGAGTSRSRAFTFDAEGRYDQTTDVNGLGRNYDYDSRGRLTQMVENTANTGSTRRTRQTDWHASFNVPLEARLYDSSAALPGTLKSRTSTVYNARGQVTAICQVDPGNSTAMAYVCGNATNAPSGVRQTRTTYCEQSDVSAGTCPRLGLVKSVNGPRTDVTDVTSYTYYAADAASCVSAPTTCPYRKGDLWKVTNALGQVSEVLAYDGAGRVLSSKDINGVVTDLEYHPRGWLTARKQRGADNGSETDDAITRMEYDATGQVTKVTQPDGSFVTFTYDAAHRLTDTGDALGNSIHYILDNAGQRLQEDTRASGGALKRSLARVYDTLGQLQTLADAYATPTDYTYDANGRLDTTTDALGRVGDNTYDALGRLTQSIANALGSGNEKATTSFAYDTRDLLVQVTDPKGLNTGYGYNGLGDQTSLVSPDTGTTSYVVNAAGLRTRQTDARNKVSNYTYDALGRLTEQSLPTAAQKVTFDYDTAQPACQTGETFSKGRLTRERYEAGNTVYCYDRRGQRVRQVQTLTSGTALTVGATYDAAGRLTAMTYPSGAIVTYVRNGNGQIARVDAQPSAGASQVTLVSNATYLPFGPLSTLTFGSGFGRTLSKNYDLNYGIDAVSDNAAGNPLSADFTLNALGNITGLSERTGATTTVSRSFAYDGLDRLTRQQNGATVVESFGYDSTGNRLSKNGGAYSYPAGSHRLSSASGTARTYDGNGNTTAIGTGASAKNFVYDDRNRLREVRQGTTLKATYAYNGRGERVGVAAATLPTQNSRQYAYDEAGRLLGEYTTAGLRLKEYVWLDDLLVAILGDHDGSTYQYVETDHLGTPRAVVHPSQNQMIWRWNLNNTAFGEHLPSENPDGNGLSYTLNLRYPGQYFDAESGLHYNYFRDYEPGTGRYTQSDPIGLDGGMSTYGYVGGSPLTAYDRYGLCWSNERAVGHYFAGGGRTLQLSEIGCTSVIGSKVQPQRNLWISRVKAAAENEAYAMACGTWKRMNMARSVGVNSGIFWIGGFSLLQDADCVIQKKCGSTAGAQCARDSFTFDCVIGSRMHDLFVNPSDFDNSAGGSNPDFWDEYGYGGTPFHVDGSWYDKVSGGGDL